MKPRICEVCGSDRYFAREFPRVRDEALFWERKAKQLAARVQQLELDAEFNRFKDRTDVAWLQGKVVAQARELKRLNDAKNVRRIKEELDVQPDLEVSSITKTEVGM